MSIFIEVTILYTDPHLKVDSIYFKNSKSIIDYDLRHLNYPIYSHNTEIVNIVKVFLFKSFCWTF